MNCNTSDELLNTLALLQVEGIGDVTAKKLIAHCGSAKAVFCEKHNHLLAIEGVGTVLAKNLKDRTIFEKAEKELKFIADQKITPLFFKDDNYPTRLKHCTDSPVLLFTKGAINLNRKKIISIVGTRQATPYGIDFCKNLISDLAPLDPVIISGFAYGIDIAAHQAAMDNNLQTIGILAHGLNRIYPLSHKRYISKMSEHGGFMTDFWSSSMPDRENFIKRNRIVAGLSEATVVVESAVKGGSLITANMAFDYNRDVFAVPGRINDRGSQGCNMLIKQQKASVLTSAADLVYMLNWGLEKEKEQLPSIQKQIFMELNNEEELIYGFLNQNGKEVLDVIAMKCNVSIHKTSSILFGMEAKGAARPLPGRFYEAV